MECPSRAGGAGEKQAFCVIQREPRLCARRIVSWDPPITCNCLVRVTVGRAVLGTERNEGLRPESKHVLVPIHMASKTHPEFDLTNEGLPLAFSSPRSGD